MELVPGQNYAKMREAAVCIATVSVLSVVLSNAVVNPGLTLLLFLGAAAALLLVERPDLGLSLIVLLTPIETLGPLRFFVSKVAKLGLALVVGVALLTRNWKPVPAQNRDPYRWPFLLILVAGVPATLLATTPLTSLAGLASPLIFIVYYSAVRRSRVLIDHGPRVLLMVLASAVLCSAMCCLQLTHGYTGYYGSAEQQANLLEQSVYTLWPGIWRTSAAFNGPNAAGAFLTIGAIIAVSHVVLFRESRWRYLLAGLVCWIGLLTTFSRGALLGSLIGCTFLFWVMGRWSRRRWLLLFATAGVLVGTLSLNDSVKAFLRLGSDLVSTSPERVDAWQASLVLWKRNPVFGIGFYQFHELSQSIVRTSDTPQHSHNGFLKQLVEEGPLGGVAYILYFLCFVSTAKKTARGATSPGVRWTMISVAGIGASLFTQELFDAGFTIGSSSVAILFATLLALQTSSGSDDRVEALA